MRGGANLIADAQARHLLENLVHGPQDDLDALPEGGGIDAEDFAGDVIGPLLAAPAAALGQGVEIILRPVYEVIQQVPGLGVCN